MIINFNAMVPLQDLDLDSLSLGPMSNVIFKRLYSIEQICIRLMRNFFINKCTRFFIRNMFIRNLHVESSKIKKLLLRHSISISEIRNLFFSNSYN